VVLTGITGVKYKTLTELYEKKYADLMGYLARISQNSTTSTTPTTPIIPAGGNSSTGAQILQALLDVTLYVIKTKKLYLGIFIAACLLGKSITA